MRGIEVFLNAVPELAGGDASGTAVRGRYVCSAHRDHRATSQLEQPLPHPEHRDHLRHDFARTQGVGANGDRGAAESLCVVDDSGSATRRHGHRRAGPGRGRKDCSSHRATTARSRRGVLRTTPDVHELGGPPGARWRPGDEADPDLPLAEVAEPQDNVFVNLADQVFNTVHSNDFSFFEEVAEILQEEPTEALDPERAGQLAAIGLVAGQPFAPDERLRGILSRPRRSAPGSPAPSPTSRATRRRALRLVEERLRGRQPRVPAQRRTPARCPHPVPHLATVVTPAMAHAQVGAGSAYAYTVHDSNGDLLDGSRTYRLHVDPDVPAKNFWAVDLYDTQTRSLLQVPSTIYPPWPATPEPSRPTTTDPTTSTSAPWPPRARKRTGSRPSPASRGSSSSGSTARCRPGSTRPGGSTNSSRSTDPV